MGKLDGHCLCGQITYQCDAEPLFTALCHCTSCQRQTGTAFSVVVGVPRDVLAIQGDALGSFTTVGEDTGVSAARRFCTACGSPIVTLPEAPADLAIIKAGTLNDPSWLDPAIEMWVRSAHPYVAINDQSRAIYTRDLER